MLLAHGAAREPALEWVRRYNDPAILPLFGLSPSKVESARPGASSRRTPREAITKALAVSQRAAANFLATGGCVSCHADHLNGMAVGAARPLGIQADYQLEARQSNTTATLRGSIEQQLFQVQDTPAGVDGMEFSILQIAAAKLDPKLSTDSLVHHIAAMQRREGDWPNYGSAVRPPLEDGGFSHTAKGIRVLRTYPIPGAPGGVSGARGTRRELAGSGRTAHNRGSHHADPGDLLGRPQSACRSGAAAAFEAARGWGLGQTDSLASDAYATGETLWALHEAGTPASDPVYARGVDFLLRTQKDDGTWHVATRALAFQPYFQSGFPHDHDQWISQAGTAMAAIALTFAVR